MKQNDSVENTVYDPKDVVTAQAVADLIKKQAEMISLAKSMLQKMAYGHFTTVEGSRVAAGLTLKDMGDCLTNEERT